MLKILAIDDNSDNLISLKAIIDDAFPGSAVFTALNGTKGIELAIANNPDVILLDIIMPGMDGFEVCRLLKLDEPVSDIPVVFLTALKGDKENRIRALEVGAEGFLSKPIDETELTVQIRAMVKIKAANEHKRAEKERLEKLVEERTASLQNELKERKKTEKSLKQSEERFQMLFNQAPLGYQSLDFDGCFLEVNQQWLDTLGFSRKEVIGKWFGDFLSPEYKEGFRQRFPLFKAQGHSHSEFEMVHKNGSKIFIAFEEKIGYDIDGEFKQTHCILQDITQKKLAEEALKKSLSLTEATLESIHNGILVVDHNGTITKTNRRFAEMWQISDEMLAMGDDKTLLNSILVQLADPDGFFRMVTEVYQKPETESFDLIAFKDGRVFDRVSKPMYVENIPKGRVWSFFDITERKKAKDELIESQSLYHSFIEQLPNAVFRKDREGRFILANSKFCELKGLTMESLIGHNPMEVAASEIAVRGVQEHTLKYAALGDQIHDQILQTGKTVEQEEIYINPDGSKQYLHVMRMPVADFNGNIIGTQGIMFDITQRKLAEQARKESYEFNQSLLKTIPFVMDIVDELGNILFQSENMENVFSKSAVGCKCWDLYRDDKSQCPDCPLKTGIEIGKTANYESKGVLGDRIFSISHTGMMFQGKRAMLEIFQDITDRKQTEKELSESQQLFSELFNASPDAIILIDPHHPTITWPVVDCNEASCRMNGYMREEMIGQSIDLLNGNNGTLEERKSYYNILKRDGIIHTEIAHLHKDGHIFPIETSSSIMNIGGHEMVLGIDRDITDRKQAEIALKESEDRYRQFISQVSEGVYRFECDEPIDINLPLEEQVDFIYDNMFIAECNDAFLKIYGINDRREIIGKGHLFFHGGRYNPVNREALVTFVKNGYRIENVMTEEINQRGQTTYISHNSLGIIENNQLVRMWGTQIDITQKIRADRVQQVLYTISNATFTSNDLHELIEIISNELARLLDSTNFFIAFYDESTNMLSTLYEKGDKDNINNWSAEKSLTGYIIKHQKSLLANETDILKLCEAGEIEIVGIASKIWMGVPLSVNKKVIGAIVVQSYDNPDAFTEKDKLMLEFVSHQISISIERKKSEQELNSALIRAQESDRLKSAFLANMSHEIRTPLNSIIGFSELLLDPDFDSDQIAEFAQIIVKSGNGLLSIISDIMDLSKIEAGEVKIYAVAFSVQNLLRTIQREYSMLTAEKGIQLITDPMNFVEEIILKSDEGRIRQVLVNLISNAIKFTFEGSISIGLQITGSKIQFSVRDTGIGIPLEYQDKIFGRFRQVESADSRKYGGNGLGLAISKNLVELMGGEICMESEPGKGSTFYFTIPMG